MMQSEKKEITILVVDDDHEIRQALSVKLNKMGYAVIDAADGEAGLHELESQQPDLVLLDVDMPGKNGFEFCEAIEDLALTKHIPIMIMTAYDDHDSVNKAYEKGASDFITKPINFAKLEHRIRFALRAGIMADSLKNREQQLLASQKIAKLADWSYDPGKAKFHCSDEVATIFGVQAKPSLTFDELMQYANKNDIDMIRQSLERVGSNDSQQIEFSLELAEGQKKIIRQIIDNEQREHVTEDNRVFGIFQDVTDIRTVEDKVKTLSFFDELTGLPNRQFFKRVLDKTIAAAKRNNRRFALLDINCDKFMRINTNLGHEVGDQLLIAASKRLASAIRASDEIALHGDVDGLPQNGMLAYFGSDNFIILLKDIDNAEDAAVVARRIKFMFEQAFEIYEHEIHMTTSIGISLYPDDADSADDLLKKVTIALHNAKETGRNCYRFYDGSMNKQSFQRLTVESGLRKALARHEFILYYQPKISMHDYHICGAEALIRWEHPERGLVPPAEFIPVAEASGLIVPMTDWVIMEACWQLSEWRKKGLDIESVAINVTPASLLDKNINDHIFKSLQLAGVESSNLDIEITESVLMQDVEVILPILQELRDLGASISVDDFGTGYSSLAYLKRLPISKLKIDQIFIRELLNNKEDQAIVNAVITMAHNLGLKVIAEGVEELEQLQFMQAQSCDVIQGFYYSRPLPAAEFYEWAMQYQASLKKDKPVLMVS